MGERALHDAEGLARAGEHLERELSRRLDALARSAAMVVWLWPRWLGPTRVWPM